MDFIYFLVTVGIIGLIILAHALSLSNPNQEQTLQNK